MNKFFPIFLFAALLCFPTSIFSQTEKEKVQQEAPDRPSSHPLQETPTKIASTKRPNKNLPDLFEEAYQAFNADRNVRVGKVIKPHPSLPKVYQKGDKFGLTLKNDKITSADFEQIIQFEDQRWIAKKGGKYGALNFGGEVVIPFVYASLIRFKEGNISDYQVSHHNQKEKKEVLSLVVSRYIAQDAATQKFGIIDGFNRLVLPFEYDLIEVNYGYKHLTLQKDGKMGVLDLKLKTLVPMEYEQVRKANQSFWTVTKNGKTGLLKDGEIVLAPEYKYINPSILPCQKDKTNPSFSIASKGDNAIGLLAQDNSVLLPFEYQNIRPMFPIRGFVKPGDDCNYLFAVMKNEEWKVVGSKGKELMSTGQKMMREFLPLKNDKVIYFDFGPSEKTMIGPDGKNWTFNNHMIISTGFEFRDHKKILEEKHPGKELLAMIFERSNRKYTHYILDDGTIIEMK